MSKKLKEIIDFLKNEEGWDKEEIVNEFVCEVIKDFHITNCSPDELTLTDGTNEYMSAEAFALALFDKIIDGVCNVIKTS